jgi:hypothetical protein
MLPSHIGQSSVPKHIAAIVFPRPRGGVAPSRHEVALADYIEKQWACRRPKPSDLAGTPVAAGRWSTMQQARLAAIRMLGYSRREAR